MSSDLDIAKAGAEALMRPFSDLIDKLAGSAAEELGLTLRDHVQVFRLKRQLRLWQRTQEMLKAAGLQPTQVPFKSLAAIVQNASMEDDDYLQDQWAALLANNAAGNYLDRVYPEILRQLSAADAQLLRMCLHVVLRAPYNRMAPPWANSVSPAIHEFNEARKRHQVWECQHVGSPVSFPTSDLSVENLTRLGLFIPPTPATRDVPEGPITLSRIGYEFAMACEEPAVLKQIGLETNAEPRF